MHVLSELYADSARKVDPLLIKRTRTPLKALSVFLCYCRNDDNSTNQNAGRAPLLFEHVSYYLLIASIAVTFFLVFPLGKRRLFFSITSYNRTEPRSAHCFKQDFYKFNEI